MSSDLEQLELRAENRRLREKVARIEALCEAKESAQRRANELYAQRNIVEAKTGRPFEGVPILTCREIRAALDGA